ncbi:unnamed protein product [Polarella glacialis]|uniref:DUF4116 domain-containing protein n=1 Tax=Polarella glacialis TaxID=89957 RepID=A0A813LWF1_POLGL|nr:unnamed protein product [Polarella glacialis]
MRLLHADLQGDREILESAVQQDWCCLTLALEEFPIELDLLIQINWQVFAHLPEAYKAEPQIVWAAVSQNWRALEFATKACKANPEIMMMAAHQNSKAIFLAEPELYANKQVVSFVVQLDGMLLRLASDDLKNDAEIVLQAVLQDWQSLQFASAEVRADQQVVFAAFVQDSTAFDWISPSLKLEPQVMHAFLRHDRTILDRLPDEIFLDVAFVTALANDDKFGHQTVVQLCQRNWQVLGLLPSKFQRDKKVILTCIEKDWQAIELAAERQLCQNVWADLDFVRAAVLQNAQCMSQAEDKIWDDSEIVISAMKQDIKIIDLAEEDIQEKLWNNEEVVMEAIKQDPKAIRKAAKGMWLQKEVVLPAVTGDWTVMNFCPKSNAKGWWADRDIVLAAVAQCADALGLADKLMWEDRDLVLSAVKTSYEILTKCPGHLKSDYYQDRDMVMEAVQQDAMALKEFNEEFFSDLEVVAIAARQNIVIIDSVQPKFTKRRLAATSPCCIAYSRH